MKESEHSYLLKKLEQVRSDCQWLLGLGAAGILGVLIKDGFGSALPTVRLGVLTLSILQIVVSMLGAMARWEQVDKNCVADALASKLRLRLGFRNASVVMLAVSFVIIAILAWLEPVKNSD